MSEEGKDLKKGPAGPSGDDQPENGASGASGATGATGPEDKVTISKSELEKLQKDASDADNLRGAVKRLNREKGRHLPEQEPDRKKSKSEDDEDDDDDDDGREEFLTRKDLIKRDERTAINKACDDPIVDENWNEIMAHYTPKRGKDSAEDILADIKDAKEMWLALNPQKKPDIGKKNTAEIANDKGLNKGKEKHTDAPKERKIIIKPKEKMENWYDKDKK